MDADEEQEEETPMENYDPAESFNERVAENYDKHVRGDEDAAVAFLERLANGGPALELAIGTGRIAIPLAARGIRVEGIDISAAMINKLRSKPGGDNISANVGDCADVAVARRYRLIYIVFNSLFNLMTQENQVRCFQNAAAHLDDGGAFVVEGNLPTEFCQLRNNQYVDLEDIAVGEIGLDVARYDPVTQILEESHVTVSGQGVRFKPLVTRYIWPGEMDLMARLAGLSLKERWANWHRDPIKVSSTNCISVYGQ